MLLNIAKEMEQLKSVDEDVTTELAMLYRTIADLTMMVRNQDGGGAQELSADMKAETSPNRLKFEIIDTDTPRKVAPYDSLLTSIDASKFMVRGPMYTVDGKKVPSGPSVYEFLGWNGFKVKSKFYHASRFITAPLPPKIREDLLAKKKVMSEEEFEELKSKTLKHLTSYVNGIPRYVVVNLQTPDYDPKVFGGPWDGQGFGVVVFFSLTDAAVRQLEREESKKDEDDKEEDEEEKKEEEKEQESEENPIHPHAVKLLQRFMSGDLSTASDRSTLLGRSKCFPVCMNFEDIANMNRFVVKSLKRYNGKPLLTAPQHIFYRGNGYMELNMDLHRYSYVQRSLSRAARSIYNKAVLGVAFSVEGRDFKELPEQMYACVSLDRLNFDELLPIEDFYDVPEDRLPGHTRW